MSDKFLRVSDVSDVSGVSLSGVSVSSVRESTTVTARASFTSRCHEHLPCESPLDTSTAMVSSDVEEVATASGFDAVRVMVDARAGKRGSQGREPAITRDVQKHVHSGRPERGSHVDISDISEGVDFGLLHREEPVQRSVDAGLQQRESVLLQPSRTGRISKENPWLTIRPSRGVGIRFFFEDFKSDIYLQNIGYAPIAFKIFTTSRTAFFVRPNEGLLQPGDQTSVQCILRGGHWKSDLVEKFLVLSAKVDMTKFDDNVKKELFRNLPKPEVFENRLPIRCIESKEKTLTALKAAEAISHLVKGENEMARLDDILEELKCIILTPNGNINDSVRSAIRHRLHIDVTKLDDSSNHLPEELPSAMLQAEYLINNVLPSLSAVTLSTADFTELRAGMGRMAQRYQRRRDTVNSAPGIRFELGVLAMFATLMARTTGSEAQGPTG